jgi:hypothetical protein
MDRLPGPMAMTVNSPASRANSSSAPGTGSACDQGP